MSIVTTQISPPVPDRRWDWMAHVDGDEEGPTGYGETEAEAVRDLAEKLVEAMDRRLTMAYAEGRKDERAEMEAKA